MRPLILRLEGLRSYVEQKEIDFRDRQLVAIVGDTGAGKSSILEAICFALYGSPSWDNRNVKELISHGVETMQVELVFWADGQEWTVFRTTSRRNYPRARTKLTCEALGIAINKKTDVDRKIVELIGLGYDAFLRAVILPQGRFQQLLRATKKDRSTTLKGIFRLDLLARMREWTEECRDEANAAAGNLARTPSTAAR